MMLGVELGVGVGVGVGLGLGLGLRLGVGLHLQEEQCLAHAVLVCTDVDLLEE